MDNNIGQREQRVRQDDLLLNSHLLAYESLVGTLTKQVLAQQEQLSELRTIITNQHQLSSADSSYSRNVSVAPPAVRDLSPSLERKERQKPSARVQHDNDDLVHSPEADDFGHVHSRSLQYDKMFEMLEPQVLQIMSEHLNQMEERIAESLASRIRRITKEHVMRSVDREIRRVLRDQLLGNDKDLSSLRRSGVEDVDRVAKQQPKVETSQMGNLSSRAEQSASSTVRGSSKSRRTDKAKSTHDIGKAKSKIGNENDHSARLLREMGLLREKLVSLERQQDRSHISRRRSPMASRHHRHQEFSALQEEAQRRHATELRSSSTSTSSSSASASPSDISTSARNVTRTSASTKGEQPHHSTANYSVMSTRSKQASHDTSIQSVDHDVDLLLSKFRALCDVSGKQ